MDKPTHLIEFEMMLVGRHLNFFGPRRRDAGRLDRSAYTMLSRLSAQGPMSIGQLSDAFGLDSSTVNRQTSALLKTGLAERIPDPDGGIARKFQITEDGARRLDHERARAIESLERVLVDWDADDVAEFARYLERFNTDIERLSGSPWTRRADIGHPKSS
ncbi:MarR family transcriptional regulator [Rhodococcus sp. HNM0563]|uniref:MarR family winged helix-turn-helix transcriptional regulator n=1 Tax=unclassified Rhodococcus (in: high G+C Gram-positive bacteria) TaxID=192944 RepID=UPI001469CEC5|nr:MULTISPECIES: MarR family transcriptional regulator [unclassified Rhodococcus (in: high G+C Gram-positive bacteria)]MCK0091131.1 MarR family transcriptional regulator [Rhodococcus sp. F64268]NLU60828.1 MarR family transcriptional regulator [Rhodococcus sp. HNM0563]